MLKWQKFGERITEPCALVLGAFDGLHLGHLALLKAAKKTLLPVAVTTFSGGKGKQLFTCAERKKIFADAGIDFVCEIPFTEELKNTSAEDFLAQIFQSIEVRATVCGEDFKFGREALGTPALLKTYSQPLTVIKTVEKNGEKVATSRCKQLVLEHRFTELKSLCDGMGYFIGGTVEHGRKVGRTYDFPTLNLSIPAEKLLPDDGVFGGVAVTPKGVFKTIINVGSRPTFGVEERKIEAHLLGFCGDLYGAEVQVYPTRFLRPITQFSSAEALKAQLQKDKRSLEENDD